MGKRILVLTASGRKHGNTEVMAEAFIDAAADKGHILTKIDTAFEAVKPCYDCKGCFKTPMEACCCDDTFNKIAKAILHADAVVFVLPVYWYSVPASIKLVIDKFWSFIIGEVKIEGKEAALISACEEPHQRVFDGVVYPYERSLQYLKWKNVGEVLVTDCFELGAIQHTDGVARAAALADKF